MKNYFVELTNGSDEWFEARNDTSAINKARKIETRVRKDTGNKYVYIYYLAECFEEDEEDRVVVSMY